MVSFLDILVLIGMAIVRFGIPIAVTALLVYFLKRLDRRWEEEARAAQRTRQEAEAAAEQPVRQQPARRRQAPVPAPGPALPPFVPPSAPSTAYEQPGMAATAQRPGVTGSGGSAHPCWNLKHCTETNLAKCAAPKHLDQACWQARWAAEGSIPDECAACDIFQRYPMM